MARNKIIDKSKNVNLDALIPREDFAATDDLANTDNPISSVSLSELRKGIGFFLTYVRKPDFQRETADWDVQKVSRFIKSFVDGEFIPAVILWKSQSGLVFVIDGSHRLSSLIAWVNDDYGDKQLSIDAYEGEVPEAQRNVAKEARELINLEVGQYSDYFAALSAKHPSPDVLQKARHVASRGLPLHWVHGDLDRAERSFYNINQQAARIDDAEIELIQKRKAASGIAARAIAKAGKGHKYWNNFSEDTQKTIEDISASIHTMLYEPMVQRPIKTLDLPICDRSSNILMLISEFISIVAKTQDEDDSDGSATVDCLKKVSKSIQVFNSNFTGSYGLHPIIYCYSNKGGFRLASFYGAILFIQELEENSKLLNLFIKHRRRFEDYVFCNDFIIQRIINKVRRSLPSAKQICQYYIDLLNALENGITEQDTISILSRNKNYKGFISTDLDNDENVSVNFTTDTKSEVFIKQAYPSIARCTICGGLLHRNSISIDHITPKREGGLGAVDNGQLTHPYCNSGVKC